MNISILHFVKTHPSSEDDNLSYNIPVKTDMTESELVSIVETIADIKEHADRNISLYKFIIPEDWDEFSWCKKIKIITEYMSGYTGMKFITMEIKSILGFVD